MYNARYVLIGLAVFAVLFTMPFWANIGRASYTPPDLKYPDPAVAKQCVMPKQWMRAEHMQLLNDWRDAAVRDGNRVFVGQDGKQYQASLTNGCMKCHDDKKEFCDKCHNQLGVSPYCWTCHVEPVKGAK